MGKKTLLKNIVEIVPGYSFRLGLAEFKRGEMAVLQAKNILEDSTVDESSLEMIDFDINRTKSIAERNDVVISSRGTFRAGVIGLEIKKIVASSSVYILKLKKNEIMPNYLAIFLNSVIAQKQINDAAAGGSIKHLRKSDLEDVTVVLPDLETQEKIVRLYRTNKKLQKALLKKINLLDSISESAINKSLK